MGLIKSLVKEIIESIVRNLRKTVYLVTSSGSYQKELTDLKSQGIHVVEDFLSEDTCEKLRNIIDEAIEAGTANVWKDGLGDNRIFFIDTINKKMKEFYETVYFRDVLRLYTGIARPKGMLLAGRIDALPGNVGSGGGWHRDSPVTHQLKAICYLNDVDSVNGPFQYVPGSHKKNNVINSYFNRVFKPGQYRFSEEDINIYCKKADAGVRDMTAKRGTLIFADTKGIHRGKPLISGRRYVLFCYFWNKSIPDHFDRLKQ